MKDLTIHSCEQALRFSSAPSWEALSEKIRMQFSFNVGLMSMGLDIPKEDGYDELKKLCLGEITMADYHAHVRGIVEKYEVPINEEKLQKPF